MQVVHLDEVASTQDEARERFAGDPTLVTASRQQSGRGRTGSSWLNAPRAVAASLAFSPEGFHNGWVAEARPLLTLVAGLGVVEVVDGVGLKWPNDLMRGVDKAGGILTEAVGDVVVVGVGVNLWWPDAPDGMAGVLDADPGPERTRSLPEEWARDLLDAVRRGPVAWDRIRYRERCVTLGQQIRWDGDDPGEGVAVDVAADGALIVETTTGLVELSSGAVTHVRPGGP